MSEKRLARQLSFWTDESPGWRGEDNRLAGLVTVHSAFRAFSLPWVDKCEILRGPATDGGARLVNRVRGRMTLRGWRSTSSPQSRAEGGPIHRHSKFSRGTSEKAPLT